MMQYYELKSNGNTLRGMKHFNSYKTLKKPVIMLHGYFSSNKIGPNRLYVQIAEAIKQFGFEIFRCDLSGIGESDGNIEDVDIKTHINDYLNILYDVKNKYSDSPVTVIAHCIGCNIALSKIKELSNCISNMIFLSPYYSNEKTIKHFFTNDQIQELQEKGSTYRKGLYANYSFFSGDSVEEMFIKNVNASPVKINFVLSEKDQFIPKQCNERVFRQIDIKPIYIKDADHNFIENRQMLINRIIELLG